ncbi:hypothetical protein M378DRAFT_475659 [Amanita muscaria Koide BX008]|uniref:MIT domain-containing protein n=1 Tax=Amanita muscaria (strain Koide BX008) TaxID=946122 RepID=A0A0C2X8E6_AMAMK|nr:hypothetical protein M378DRAFT_475659 [Amanita muscaria Koide BX008]
MGFETPQEANVAYNHPVQPPSLSSPVSHRRRSLAYTRSPPPPPNIPIPSIPDQLQDPSYPSPSISDTDHPYSAATSPHANGFPVRSMSYSRPSASPNLTTIAAFSHNLNVKPNVGMPSLPPDDLSDPPPQSFLPTSPKRAERKRRPSGEDGLLSPNPTGRKDRQPSSRSALTRALELARHAVHLDTTNDNPAAAVEAYAQSVSLLSQVMERVRRGEDGAKRTRSPEAQEEEVRRLQNIHDTYADRMNILSIIYSIPATPYTSLAYAATATSTSSASNSSSSSITLLQTTSQSHHVSSLPYYSDGRIGDHDIDSGEIMRQAMFPIDDVPPGPAHHPYANQYDTSERNTSKTQSRFSISASRRRAGSYLPPAAPPPAESLPPAPVSANIDSKDPPPEFQQGHKRNGSGRLLRLDEKDEGSPEGQVPFSRETSDSETTPILTRRLEYFAALLKSRHHLRSNQMPRDRVPHRNYRIDPTPRLIYKSTCHQRKVQFICEGLKRPPLRVSAQPLRLNHMVHTLVDLQRLLCREAQLPSQRQAEYGLHPNLVESHRVRCLFQTKGRLYLRLFHRAGQCEKSQYPLN